MKSPSSLQPADVPRISLRSPADLVAFTPYLLGFHPTDSVVVAAFRGNRVVFAARSDLPGPETPPVGEMAAQIVAVAGRQRPDTLVILGYGPATHVDELVRAVEATAHEQEYAIKDVLRVESGRWWSYLCQLPECCPAEGTPFDPTGSEVAANCVLGGLTAATDRAALGDQVAPVSGPGRVAMGLATDRAEQALQQWLVGMPESQWGDAMTERGTAAVRSAITCYREGGRLADDELAELSVLLLAIPVRDNAWREITESEPHLRLWSDATRRVNPALVAAPASLLAFTAWRAGDAVLARLALERALAEDPAYSMAILLLEGLARGVPPSVLDGWGPECLPAAVPDDL